MPSIFGSMVVKNGIKQVIYNFSNARKKTYAQVQAMSDAEKQGVIICDDYPVSSAYCSYEKIADGTTLDELKTVLSGMSKDEYMSTILNVHATGDNNEGAYGLVPVRVDDNVRQYRLSFAPYNVNYIAMAWVCTYIINTGVIDYTHNYKPTSGTYTSTTPTVSSWELYRLKV